MLLIKVRIKEIFTIGFSCLVLLLSLVSCEETVKLDLEQTPKKYVIEGLVSNQSKHQAVKISQTANFYDSGNTPRITNALVTVTDDLGNSYPFEHNPNNHADSAGIYIPQSDFIGVVGRTYRLQVSISGEVFEAEDQLLPVTVMDSLSYRINEEEAEDPEVEDRTYEILMFTKEPQDEKNYYLFHFYRNDSLTFDEDTDIYFSNDDFLAESINGIGSPVFYGLGDNGRVEMYSLSRIGYIFYNDLFNLLNNDAGGMFGPIPASPRTNLTNGALGFFQVSAIDISEIQIE